MRALILILLFNTLIACGGRQPFQPVPDAYLLWTKQGSSILDTRKALLECGMASPGSPALPPRDPRTPDQLAAAENCMMAAGFKSAQPSHRMCAAQPNLSACRPDATPTLPSVARRLSSNYCKAEQDIELCRQTSSNPSACTPGPVEPECLP